MDVNHSVWFLLHPWHISCWRFPSVSWQAYKPVLIHNRTRRRCPPSIFVSLSIWIRVWWGCIWSCQQLFARIPICIPEWDVLLCSLYGISGGAGMLLKGNKKVLQDIDFEGLFYCCRLLFGDPGGIRTHDPQLRRLLLYPAELLDHCFGIK